LIRRLFAQGENCLSLVHKSGKISMKTFPEV
jgi:hypothetical protein